MVRNNTHITGSAGALPLWSRMANAILLYEDYGTRLDLIDIAFSAIASSGRTEMPFFTQNVGQKELQVNKGNGLISSDVSSANSSHGLEAATIITFGKTKENGEFVPSRYFQPFWTNN